MQYENPLSHIALIHDKLQHRISTIIESFGDDSTVSSVYVHKDEPRLQCLHRNLCRHCSSNGRFQILRVRPMMLDFEVLLRFLSQVGKRRSLGLRDMIGASYR